MAYEQCITLVPYLKAVPDTRHARGKRYELWVLLTFLCVALISVRRRSGASSSGRWSMRAS